MSPVPAALHREAANASVIRTSPVQQGQLDAPLFGEAQDLGIPVVVVTGGEPLLRGDLQDLISRHRRLLFVVITNGSLMTSDVARRMARIGNVVTLVSLEGFASDTDARRGFASHEAAFRATLILGGIGSLTRPEETHRRKVLELRRRKPLVLIQFPDDEHGTLNRVSPPGARPFTSTPRETSGPAPSYRFPVRT